MWALLITAICAVLQKEFSFENLSRGNFASIYDRIQVTIDRLLDSNSNAISTSYESRVYSVSVRLY